MTEVATKTDIDRLHDKLDPMAIDVAVIKAKMENLPPPRPCGYLSELKHNVDDHLADANDTKKNLRRSVISALVGVAKMAIIFLLASWVVSLQGCTRYEARIEIPVIAPDGITVVAVKIATIDMTYLLQDKTFKRFEIDPDTSRVILENFGSETSQVLEKVLEKIP